MGFSIAYVIAQWDRPLAQLRANEALSSLEADEVYSWARADGWQCFAPVEFYDGELLPPVERIQDEVRGPVLGMYVESSSQWELAFCLGGELQRFRPYPEEDEPDESHEYEMTDRWGADWLSGVASGLATWASPFAALDAAAVQAALAAPYVFPEDRLAGLQRMLTLVPDAGHPWWGAWAKHAVLEPEVPDARFVVNAISLSVPGLRAPKVRFTDPNRELVLALTGTGIGIWDRDPRAWVREPVLSLGAALDDLASLLPERGWLASGGLS